MNSANKQILNAVGTQEHIQPSRGCTEDVQRMYRHSVGKRPADGEEGVAVQEIQGAVNLDPSVWRRCTPA